MAPDTPYSVQELRHLVVDAVILNSETCFNGAQLLQKSFHVYIKSESGIPTHQYTFETISDLQQRMTLPKPIRLIFDRKHYDAIVKHIQVEDSTTSKKKHKPPEQVELTSADLGPIARKTDESLTPQAIVRADNDEWIIVGMRSKGNTQKQCTGTTTKDQHGKTPPGQTTSFDPESEGQVNGLKTGVLGALDPTSPNAQIGRDVMGRTIITDGIQRIMPRSQLAQMESPYRPGLDRFTTQGVARDNCALRMNPALVPPPSLQNPRIDLELHTMEVQYTPKRHLKSTHSVGAGVKVDKWILDLRRFNERQETVLQVFREVSTQEQDIVEHIGGSANDHTLTRRILFRLT
jgi:hypothetical protein